LQRNRLHPAVAPEKTSGDWRQPAAAGAGDDGQAAEGEGGAGQGGESG
jgi:hypothetical protein